MNSKEIVQWCGGCEKLRAAESRIVELEAMAEEINAARIYLRNERNLLTQLAEAKKSIDEFKTALRTLWLACPIETGTADVQTYLGAITQAGALLTKDAS